MPGHSDGFGGLVTPFTEEIARIAALPPPQRETERATWGAFFLGVSGSVWLTPGLYLPGSWKLGVAAAAGFGLLLLIVGLRGSGGQPRNVMGVFWNLALLGGGGWVVAHWLPGLWENFFGRTFCIGMICAAVVRLCIALRGIGGDAERPVRENMQAKHPPIVPPRRRRA